MENKNKNANICGYCTSTFCIGSCHDMVHAFVLDKCLLQKYELRLLNMLIKGKCWSLET